MEKGEKMVKLVSSDEKEFEVEERVAKQANLLKMMIEEGISMDDKPTRIINVTGDVLGTVLEYCERHAKAAGKEEEGEEQKAMMKEFDEEFMERTSLDMLHCLATASNYLEIEGLLELTTQRIADLIKGKTPDELRAFFNIKNDFTPQEYADISRDYTWAFQNFNI